MRIKVKSLVKANVFNMEKWRQEDGAAAVEYGLLVGLIAVSLILAMTSLGTNLKTTFNKAACDLQTGKTWNDTTNTCN